MPSTYCSSCGHKMSYTLQKPKFCNECGQSLATLKPSFVKQAEPKLSEENPKNIDPEGLDIYEVPDIQKLEYEIEHDTNASFTLGSLMPEPKNNKPKPKRGRPRKKK
jgi:hypothetical protein